MKDRVFSPTTGKVYYTSDVCRIVNPLQIAYYMRKGVELLDIYPSKDRWNKDILVYIVSRQQTSELYKAWCNHEID